MGDINLRLIGILLKLHKQPNHRFLLKRLLLLLNICGIQGLDLMDRRISISSAPALPGPRYMPAHALDHDRLSGKLDGSSMCCSNERGRDSQKATF